MKESKKTETVRFVVRRALNAAAAYLEHPELYDRDVTLRMVEEAEQRIDELS